MLKVSDNIIKLLKYFDIKSVDCVIFEKFMDDISSKISGLVTVKEVDKLDIDQKLLNDLEDAIDELNDYLVEEIDLDNINDRL